MESEDKKKCSSIKSQETQKNYSWVTDDDTKSKEI